MIGTATVHVHASSTHAILVDGCMRAVLGHGRLKVLLLPTILVVSGWISPWFWSFGTFIVRGGGNHGHDARGSQRFYPMLVEF